MYWHGDTRAQRPKRDGIPRTKVAHASSRKLLFSMDSIMKLTPAQEQHLKNHMNKKKTQEAEKAKQFLPEYTIEGIGIDIYGNICMKKRKSIEETARKNKLIKERQERLLQEREAKAKKPSRSENTKPRLPELFVNRVSQKSEEQHCRRRIAEYRSRSVAAGTSQSFNKYLP